MASCLLPLFLAACHDEQFGYTTEDVFRAKYEQDFVKAFGEIDPEETWDFSRFGNRPSGDVTRATEAETGWYRVDQFLIDDFFPNALKEGVNHAQSGENFCIITGHEDFTLVPVFKASTVDTWEVHMVMFDPSKADTDPGNDKIIWSNSTADVMKIQTPGCTHCGGRGYVSSSDASAVQVPCSSCNDGWVANPDCSTCSNQRTIAGADCSNCQPCTTCNGAGTTHDDLCSACGGKGGSVCTTCKGVGYISQKKNGNGNNNLNNGNSKRIFTACDKCGGGKSAFSTEISNREFRTNYLAGAYAGKLGTGQIKCNQCSGSGKSERPCSTCSGVKWFTKCQVCSGTSQVYKCGICSGTGLSDGGWHSITQTGNQNHTNAIDINTSNVLVGTPAQAIEGHPVKATSVLGTNTIPVDGVIYFYIKVNGSTVYTSMEGGMRLFTPQQLNSDTETVKLIACDVDGDNDYNDFVFLIKGSPTAFRTETGKTFTSWVDKRYMAEDFGSNADWNFNDVVFDVTRSTPHTLTGSGTNIRRQKGTSATYSSIVYLCGTLPLQVTVGTTPFAKIDNPLDIDGTLSLLIDGVADPALNS